MVWRVLVEGVLGQGKEKMSQYCDVVKNISHFFVMARPLP